MKIILSIFATPVVITIPNVGYPKTVVYLATAKVMITFVVAISMSHLWSMIMTEVGTSKLKETIGEYGWTTMHTSKHQLTAGQKRGIM